MILALAAAAVVAGGACSGKTSTADHRASVPCSPLSDPAVTLAYEAITSDGHYVVTFYPAGSLGSTSRVFYGTPGRMVEGRVTDEQKSCATYLYFDVEGVSYTATFANVSCNGNVPGRSDARTADGRTASQLLTLLDGGGGAQSDAGAAPDSFTFVCF